MSEFAVGEASIVVRPDTTKFRAELTAQLTALTKAPITVPVRVQAIGAGAAAGGIGAVTTSTKSATTAVQNFNKEIPKTTHHLGQLQRGAGATGLSLLGIRGATLAASSAFLAGAAAVTLFAKSVFSAVSLEQQLAVFAETTGATAHEMQRVSDAAREMGRDLTLPGISAGDAATAMTELAKAGLSVEDSIAGARGVLQLAIAANIDFADATQLAASALNAFGLQGDDAVHVADVLANSANAAQGSIRDMGLALQQAAAVGRQVGLSLEDTSVFLTILAREGLRGSDAGTSLRVTLGRLINPTKKISDELDKLGVSLRDANGNIRPDFFVNLGVAMSNMSKAQKDATLAIIGGMDGMRALSILTRQSIDDVVGFRQALADQGTASELAQARMTGLAGAASNLANTLQGIGISVGERVTPALTSLTNAMTSTVSTIDAVFSTINRSINVGLIVSAVAAWKLLPPILVSVAGAFRGVTLATIASSVALARSAGILLTLSAGFGALVAAINPAALLIPAIGIGLFGLATRTSEMDRAMQNLTTSVDDLSSSLFDVSQATRAAADAQSSLKTDELAVSTARVAEAQARAALANSHAAQGTIERRILENQLAIAVDNVRVSEERLTNSRQSAADSAAEAAQAEINHRRQMELTATTVAALGEVTRKQSLTRNQQIAALEELAAKQEQINTKESRDLAARLRALALLRRQIDEMPDEKTISLLLNAEDLETGLREAVRMTGAAGDESATVYTRQLLQGLKKLPTLVSNVMQQVWDFIITGWGAAGEASGAAFNRGLTEGMPRVGGGVGVELPGFAPQPSLGQAQGILETQGKTAEALVKARERVAFWAKRLQAATNQKEWETALKNWQDASADEARLEAEILSNQKAAADAVEQAAKDAEEAQRKADQAVIDAWDAQKEQLKIKIARAELTVKNLKDDVAAQKAYRAELRQEVKEAGRRIKDEATRRAVIRALTLEIVQTTGVINGLIAAQKQADRDAKKAADDARKEAQRRRRERAKERRQEKEDALQLNIQIAETNENVKGEIRARQRYIAWLKKRRQQLKEGTNEWRRVTLAIIEEQKAIEDLRKANKDKDNAAASLGFEFLQAQQGFAANVMSNLLPKGAVTGTVGGGQAPSVTPTVAQAPRGTSQGQTATMIEILRQILIVLQGQSRTRMHPEAGHQRSVGSAAFQPL